MQLEPYLSKRAFRVLAHGVTVFKVITDLHVFGICFIERLFKFVRTSVDSYISGAY
jgi:hypothetical protein